MPRRSDGHAISSAGADAQLSPPPSRAEFARLQEFVDELDARVGLQRRDLDVQFQRLAELQAVVDRIQIAAAKARAKPERGR